MKTIKFNDGELTLNDDNSLTAIGESAHKAMYRLWNVEKKGIQINESLLTGIEECRIIL